MRTRRPAPRGDPAGRRERSMGSGAWSALKQSSLCFQGPTCRRMPAALAFCRRLAVPGALPLWEKANHWAQAAIAAAVQHLLESVGRPVGPPGVDAREGKSFSFGLDARIPRANCEKHLLSGSSRAGTGLCSRTEVRRL